ncbi:thioredoxin family protein [Candidatus Bathyarchaeota archaeon]|nr:thioredoxin family protein [Candidatus Bathyarchaeota archaeon]MBS7630804.1 thioredoxin family protein [Candidatus Bathyarchaeota archaeon]
MYDISRLRKNSEKLESYLASIPSDNQVFAKARKDYQIEEKIIEGLKKYAKDAFIVVFSAEWCPDCANNLPRLAKISKEAGIEARVFGHLIRDPLNPKERWRIPPSPPEVREFNVVKIPLILVFSKKGEKLGEIVENPPEGMSLEEALLKILEG